jgi:hypothetical protein
MTPKRQVRLLLDAPTAHALHQMSLRESRSLANTCLFLIKDSLARKAISPRDKLTSVIRGEEQALQTIFWIPLFAE